MWNAVLSRIWTRIAVFISYGDNDYTTGTSISSIVVVGTLTLCALFNPVLFQGRVDEGVSKIVKSETVAKGDPNASFSIATPQGIRESATPFPGLLNFTLDTYFIMLSV